MYVWSQTDNLGVHFPPFPLLCSLSRRQTPVFRERTLISSFLYTNSTPSPLRRGTDSLFSIVINGKPPMAALIIWLLASIFHITKNQLPATASRPLNNSNGIRVLRIRIRHGSETLWNTGTVYINIEQTDLSLTRLLKFLLKIFSRLSWVYIEVWWHLYSKKNRMKCSWIIRDNIRLSFYLAINYLGRY